MSARLLPSRRSRALPGWVVRVFGSVQLLPKSRVCPEHASLIYWLLLLRLRANALDGHRLLLST